MILKKDDIEEVSKDDIEERWYWRSARKVRSLDVGPASPLRGAAAAAPGSYAARRLPLPLPAASVYTQYGYS